LLRLNAPLSLANASVQRGHRRSVSAIVSPTARNEGAAKTEPPSEKVSIEKLASVPADPFAKSMTNHQHAQAKELAREWLRVQAMEAEWVSKDDLQKQKQAELENNHAELTRVRAQLEERQVFHVSLYLCFVPTHSDFQCEYRRPSVLPSSDFKSLLNRRKLNQKMRIRVCNP
jgi:hypothetical protein